MSALWAACLAVSTFVHVGEMEVVDPVVTIFAGVRFSGDDARLVLIVEAGIFAMIALGVFTHRRWGLLLALCYMVQVVMSHLAFVIAYLPFPSEWMHVRAVASEGPISGAGHAVSMDSRMRSDFRFAARRRAPSSVAEAESALSSSSRLPRPRCRRDSRLNI